MGHKVKQSSANSRIDFFYYAFRNILLVSLPILVVSALVLSSFRSSAMNSSADSVRINLPTSCTLSGNVTAEHTASMVSGQELRDIGTTEINAICNDKDGYLVYAKGTTQNNLGEVVLASNLGSNYDIKTGNIPSSNGDSSWAMKLSLGTSTFPPTIVSDYDNKYVPVPSDWTKVVYRSASTATNSTATSIFTTTYGVYTTPGQPAGTYTGQVKYVMLHPSTTTVLPTTTLESAFASAGKSKKIGVVDPVTGQTGSFYRMQDMNSSICDAVTPNDNPGYDEIQLVDDRDNKIYWVAKLKDGHCWMTQNLDLDLSKNTTLDSNNTDLNDRSLTGAYAEGYNYNPNTGVLSWTPANNTNTWENSNVYPYSKDRGKYYPDGTPENETINDYHELNGNYYNWTATIASNNSGSLQSSTYDDVSANPQNSICPKGWRLPTISSAAKYNEFGSLINFYGNTAAQIITAPLWFIHSGYTAGSSIGFSGFFGYYWSSTVYNDIYSRFLYFSTDGRLAPNGTDADGYAVHQKSNGFSIRCLAR